MLCLKHFVFGLLVAAGVQAAPSHALEKRSIYQGLQTRSTAPGTGKNHGYYYSYYNEGNTGVTFTMGDGGAYTVNWKNDEDFVAGKGWEKGAARKIKYKGDFKPKGNAYLSVYGWTTSPLVEYYICESYGDYDPGSQLTHKGTVKTDGGEYDIYETTRTNAPSIEGTSTFKQYWSIRKTKRVGGTVTTKNHFNKWHQLGMKIGDFNYQILATEGYESSGSAHITVA